MKQFFFIAFVATSLVACQGTDKEPTTPRTSFEDKTQAFADSMRLTSIVWKDAAPALAADSGKSILERDAAFIDMGKIKKGGKAEVTFSFTNSGKYPLIIENVQPGCGCTLAKRPDQPVAPGASETIKAVYDTETQSLGEHLKHITVSANTFPASSYTLSFRVEVVE